MYLAKRFLTQQERIHDANVKVVTKSGSTETAVPTTEYTVKTKTKARKIGDKAIATWYLQIQTTKSTTIKQILLM